MDEPVAYRVKDYADGWILCHTRKVAERTANGQCLIQPLYTLAARDELLGRIEALKAELREIIKVSMGRPRSIARAALDKDAGQ